MFNLYIWQAYSRVKFWSYERPSERYTEHLYNVFGSPQFYVFTMLFLNVIPTQTQRCNNVDTTYSC